MRKGLLVGILALVLLIAFAGCASGSPENNTETTAFDTNEDTLGCSTDEPVFYQPFGFRTTPSMTWPVPSCRTATGAFGAPHAGIDIADESISRKIVVAAAPGTVKYAGVDPNEPAYGIQVRIDHGDGYMTRYAHLLENPDIAQYGVDKLQEGDTVQPGQPIGRVGSGYNAIGPHLHFEVIDIATGKQLDPLNFLVTQDEQ